MTVTNNRNQNNRLDLMAYIPSIQQFIHLIEHRKYPRKDFTLKFLDLNRVSRYVAFVIWSKVKVINSFAYKKSTKSTSNPKNGML